MWYDTLQIMYAEHLIKANLKTNKVIALETGDDTSH